MDKAFGRQRGLGMGGISFAVDRLIQSLDVNLADSRADHYLAWLNALRRPLGLPLLAAQEAASYGAAAGRLHIYEDEMLKLSIGVGPAKVSHVEWLAFEFEWMATMALAYARSPLQAGENRHHFLAEMLTKKFEYADLQQILDLPLPVRLWAMFAEWRLYLDPELQREPTAYLWKVIKALAERDKCATAPWRQLEIVELSVELGDPSPAERRELLLTAIEALAATVDIAVLQVVRWHRTLKILARNVEKFDKTETWLVEEVVRAVRGAESEGGLTAHLRVDGSIASIVSAAALAVLRSWLEQATGDGDWVARENVAPIGDLCAILEYLVRSIINAESGPECEDGKETLARYGAGDWPQNLRILVTRREELLSIAGTGKDIMDTYLFHWLPLLTQFSGGEVRDATVH